MAETDRPSETAVEWIPIEWTWDMDSVGLSIPALDDVTEFKVRTRCKRCWGSVRGRRDAQGNLTGIRCLVCGQALEGDAAKQEEDRMSKESCANAVNSGWGFQAKYGDGPFAQKVFPKIDRLTEQELRRRVTQSKRQYANSPRGKLTRREFPEGSPGWFFLQARILVDGVSRATDYGRNSVVDSPATVVNSDGSVSVQVDTERLSENPRHREHELLAAVGSLLGEGMMGAFACELALKAISLTCTDEATKTHDLVALFDELPRESRDRLTADSPTIRDVLAQNRGTFGAWRYFDIDSGTEAWHGMVNPQRSRTLVKAARVILDEAEYVGLAADLEVKANRGVRVSGDKREHRETVDLTIRGRESPPR